MADYSQPPQEILRKNREKGYVGIHLEQGVPILDRDLNLLQDLVATTMREIFTRYIGNGTAHDDDGFAIEALPAQDGRNKNDFSITAGPRAPGSCLVGGIEVIIPETVTYRAQHLDDLTTPVADRTDLVYLDVTLVEEDGSAFTELLNAEDVGVQTSVRIKPAWVVRVHEGAQADHGRAVLPDAPSGHTFHPLAVLTRKEDRDTIEPSDIRDLRQRRLTVSDMESRLSRMEQMLALPSFDAPRTPEFRPRRGVINQQITLGGSNFDVGTVEVFFGAKKARLVSSPSRSQIVALVPPGLTPDGAVKRVAVSVRNEIGTSTSSDLFTVQPDPTFDDSGSQFSPTHGIPETLVDIKGFNFDVGTPRVFFDDVEAQLDGPPSAERLQARVPNGLVPADETSADVTISVETAAGRAVSEDRFTAERAIPAPTFAGPPLGPFRPKHQRVNQRITLVGTNLNTGFTKVTFGNTTANLEGTPTAEEVAVVVPTGLPPGAIPITVETEGGKVTSEQKFVVDP